MTTRSHHCHAIGCRAPCPPAHLMCGRHWRTVPPDLQREVYATVRCRGRFVDASWAPWWRAQARAIHAVVVREQGESERAQAWLDKELRVADKLTARSVAAPARGQR